MITNLKVTAISNVLQDYRDVIYSVLKYRGYYECKRQLCGDLLMSRQSGKTDIFIYLFFTVLSQLISKLYFSGKSYNVTRNTLNPIT